MMFPRQSRGHWRSYVRRISRSGCRARTEMHHELTNDEFIRLRGNCHSDVAERLTESASVGDERRCTPNQPGSTFHIAREVGPLGQRSILDDFDPRWWIVPSELPQHVYGHDRGTEL